MNENYCALMLALTAKRLFLPEEAFQALLTGKSIRRRDSEVVCAEMINMRDQGFSWDEIAEIFDYSKRNVQCMVSKYKKKNRMVA